MGRKRKSNSPAVQKRASAKYRARCRQEALDYLGHRCELCSEMTGMLLVLDHKNRDGAEERRAGFCCSNFCKQVAAGTRPDIRCLCHNCNFFARILGSDIKVINIPFEVAQEVDPLTYRMSKQEVWKRIREMESCS